MNKKRAMVAGHLCLDITPVFPDGLDVTGQLFVPGKMIQVEAADIHTGGVVSNTGLAMRKMGADVILTAKIGRDKFGDSVAAIMKSYQAEEGLLVSENSTTSYSIVLAPPGLDRMFLHHSGANDELTAEELTDAMNDEIDLFHFGYPPVMKQIYQNQGQGLEEVYRRAGELGIITSLDLCVADPQSPAGRENWPLILERVLPYVDIFVPSIEELCSMVWPEVYREWLVRAGGKDMVEILDYDKDIVPLAEKVMSMGPKVLLLKCGSRGLYYGTSDAEGLSRISRKFQLDVDEWADCFGFETSYRPEKIRSATGAGDTCVAAFLTSLMRGYPLKKCVRLAAAQGASCVESYDALSGLRTLEELEEKIEAGWKKTC
ncbi:Uncharacterized sugar kinase ydjH [uncultured Roseburia sp.]|uniref:Carbohydrate kinase family protein n=1 Tax=Brotonthovivens ammoniilytica TaxID=2981725 RepID=A0ABT2TLD1_9FIRM|nr:carbohydrate kinase family protein [Brotonthovivens ammoniilytica]MCU6762641.1 carbohydrate kinase family protein [Brotonthovivens ammoniilytica]SCI78383.1 Uncharacterized sugar kinase ydjH [uncultured Roseburia sp.]